MSELVNDRGRQCSGPIKREGSKDLHFFVAFPVAHCSTKFPSCVFRFVHLQINIQVQKLDVAISYRCPDVEFVTNGNFMNGMGIGD